MFRKKIKDLILLSFFLAGGGLIFVYQDKIGEKDKIPPNKDYVVELHEDGFYPKEITIARGEELKFVTTLDRSFWPASNLHPTHTLYSEFDPNEPIRAKEAWTFRFDKTGAWGYHDHLAPYIMGKIIVIEVQGSAPLHEQDCKNTKNSPRCWHDLLIASLYGEGLEATFNLVGNLYVDEPSFRSSCHFFAHDVGLAAYNLFLRDPNSIVVPGSNFCAHGFYHGFMEAVLTDIPKPKRAREVCDFFKEKITSDAPDAAMHCYHGIGHGAMDVMVRDTGLWGKDRAIIDSALKFCEDVSLEYEPLYRCASGVFNGIANFYIKSEYGLSIDKDDPLWICEGQSKEKRHLRSCYGNMNAALVWLAEDNFKEATRFIEKINDEEEAEWAVWYLAGNYVSMNELENFDSDYESIVLVCRSLRDNLRTPCLTGLAQGFFEHGTPGFEYVDALRFCRSGTLAKDERDICVRSIIDSLTTLYTREEAGQVCTTLEEEYQQYCLDL